MFEVLLLEYLLSPDEQLCSLLQSQSHLVSPLQGVGVQQSLWTEHKVYPPGSPGTEPPHLCVCVCVCVCVCSHLDGLLEALMFPLQLLGFRQTAGVQHAGRQHHLPL